MAIFPSYEPEEWAFFAIIFAALGIFLGGLNSFSDHWLIYSAGQFLALPRTLFIYPLLSTGNALLAIVAVVGFFIYIKGIESLFTRAFLAAAIVGLIAIMLGA